MGFPRRTLSASKKKRQSQHQHCIRSCCWPPLSFLKNSTRTHHSWFLRCCCVCLVSVASRMLLWRSSSRQNSYLQVVIGTQDQHFVKSSSIRGGRTAVADHRRSSSTGPMMPLLPYGETDDLRYGRHCTFTGSSRFSWLPLWPGTSPWTCVECLPNADNYDSFRCTPLKPRGQCRPFRRREPDQTPRVKTEWSPLTSQRSSTLVLHHDGHKRYAKHGIGACSGTLSLPCFNLTKCATSTTAEQQQKGGRSSTISTTRLKVFPYGKTVESQLDFAIEQRPDLIQKVDTPQEACLLVVGNDSLQAPGQLETSASWNSGQNHYLFNSSYLLDSHADRPFNTFIEAGMAATSPCSMDDAYHREGYDTPLGLYPWWIRPAKYASLDIHRKRRLLLAFKGNIYPWEQRSWQHRWIASEYWYGQDNVHVDTKCRGHDYDEKGPEVYEELLLNSTFFFCPGGGGTNSYRFPEVLAADGIPVVTSEFLPPFAPDIDWSSCIVRVSEARVVDIPNIVGNISAQEVRMRQQSCAKLSRTVFGNPPDVKQHFSVAMQVWAIRVRNALRKQEEIRETILS